MSRRAVFDVIETDRLILRRRRPDEAAIYRQLWSERDVRVPPHRRIDPQGRPSVADVAAQIRAEGAQFRPGLLAVELRAAAEVIGYCGLVFDAHGSPEDPELAFELLRAHHGHGYATEAGLAVLARVSEMGYPQIWATVREWNVASRRVLAKLGFRETDRIEPDADYGDTLLTVREF